MPPTLQALVDAFAARIALEAESRGAILERIKQSLSLGYEQLTAALNQCLLDHTPEPVPVPPPPGGELVADVSSQTAVLVELCRQTGALLGTLNLRLEGAISDALAGGATAAQLAPLGTVSEQLKGLGLVLEGALTPITPPAPPAPPTPEDGE